MKSLKQLVICAGAAAMAAVPSIAFAGTATINASGSMPAACSVSGTDITLNPQAGLKTLSGSGTGVSLAGNSLSRFSLDQVSFGSVPGNDSSNLTASISVNGTGGYALASTSTAGADPIAWAGGSSPTVNASITTADNTVLPAGTYAISSTLTCVN
jgi:hypothetical protein